MASARGRFLLGVAISGGLLFLLFRALDPTRLWEHLALADLRALPIAIFLYFVGAWVRSIRWGLLLPVGAARTPVLFRALVVGFTVNNLLPARLGEVARAYLLSRWCSVAYGATFASVVVERVLDGLALAGLLLVALLFIPAPGYLVASGYLVGSVFVGGAVLVGLASSQPGAIVSVGRLVARPMPVAVRPKVERLARSFAVGLGLIRGWKLLLQLAVLSVLAWSIELNVFFVLLFAFALPPSLPLAFLSGTAANFATLVPSSPGYVGTFDSVLVQVLRDVAQAPLEQAAAYAFVVHATLLIPVVVVGLLILWRSDVSLADLTGASARSPVGAAPVASAERSVGGPAAEHPPISGS